MLWCAYWKLQNCVKKIEAAGVVWTFLTTVHQDISQIAIEIKLKSFLSYKLFSITTYFSITCNGPFAKLTSCKTKVMTNVTEKLTFLHLVFSCLRVLYISQVTHTFLRNYLEKDHHTTQPLSVSWKYLTGVRNCFNYQWFKLFMSLVLLDVLID